MTKRNAIGLAIMLGALILRPGASQAQPTFTTLYSFLGGSDGSTPNSWCSNPRPER
jgi:hypothetical protein